MIDVLLGAFDGESFLAEQIESVLTQASVPLRILARDDGSSDGTAEILERYASEDPGRFVLLRSPGRLGAGGNFGFLLDQSKAPYVAFCDQDDVWKPAKLSILLARMHALEQRHGAGTPLLVHSDLEVVGPALEPIAGSYWRRAGIDSARCALPQVLIKNPVTGCALLANRTLVDLARPVPPEAALHDHWLALVAAAFGRIEAVAEPLVRYRQHSANVVGAERYGWRMIVRRALTECGRLDIDRPRRQARAFVDRYAERLAPAQRTLVDGFARLPERSWLARRAFLVTRGVLFPGLARNLALLFCARLGDSRSTGRPDAAP